jgi:hypothetical protein
MAWVASRPGLQKKSSSSREPQSFSISEEDVLDVLGARHSSGASFSLFAAPYDASLE